MPRAAREDPRTLFACREAFAVFNGGVPDLYAPGRHVLGGDPILRTHRQFFVEAADLVAAKQSSPQSPPPVEPRLSPNEYPDEEVGDA